MRKREGSDCNLVCYNFVSKIFIKQMPSGESIFNNKNSSKRKPGASIGRITTEILEENFSDLKKKKFNLNCIIMFQIISLNTGNPKNKTNSHESIWT